MEESQNRGALRADLSCLSDGPPPNNGFHSFQREEPEAYTFELRKGGQSTVDVDTRAVGHDTRAERHFGIDCSGEWACGLAPWHTMHGLQPLGTPAAPGCPRPALGAFRSSRTCLPPYRPPAVHKKELLLAGSRLPYCKHFFKLPLFVSSTLAQMSYTATQSDGESFLDLLSEDDFREGIIERAASEPEIQRDLRSEEPPRGPWDPRSFGAGLTNAFAQNK